MRQRVAFTKTCFARFELCQAGNRGLMECRTRAYALTVVALSAEAGAAATGICMKANAAHAKTGADMNALFIRICPAHTRLGTLSLPAGTPCKQILTENERGRGVESLPVAAMGDLRPSPDLVDVRRYRHLAVVGVSRKRPAIPKTS